MPLFDADPQQLLSDSRSSAIQHVLYWAWHCSFLTGYYMTLGQMLCTRTVQLAAGKRLSCSSCWSQCASAPLQPRRWRPPSPSCNLPARVQGLQLPMGQGVGHSCYTHISRFCLSNSLYQRISSTNETCCLTRLFSISLCWLASIVISVLQFIINWMPHTLFLCCAWTATRPSVLQLPVLPICPCWISAQHQLLHPSASFPGYQVY